MLSSPTPIRVFYSYAHEDRLFCDELEKHLSLLRRQGLITQWHDRYISPGSNWAQAISMHLERASMILLLVSADFLASDYCYSIEMQRALERHQNKEARVIPILLRPVDWKGAPFAQLQALPTNAKPITTWSNQDEAFADVAIGLRRAIEDLSFLLNGQGCSQDSELHPSLAHQEKDCRLFSRSEDLKVNIADIAHALKMRKNSNQSMVLFLGSRAGVLFHSQPFYEIMKQYSTRNFNALSHQEQFGECYKLLQQDRFGEREIHSILTQSLREIAPTEANICLAELVKQDLFDIIVSTNVDTFLEDAFKEMGMEEPHDFDVCIPEHDALHHLTYSGKKLSCRVVKAFGDLGSRKYNIAGRGFYLDALQDLKNFVAHISTCDVLVVGFDPVWDADMTYAFTVGKGSLWLVTEEDSLNTHPLASLANQGRQVKHVTGKFASSEQFLKALHQHFYENWYLYERDGSRKEDSGVSEKILKVNIADIAHALKMRKNSNQSTVLFLGSRAGVLFRSQPFYEIMKQYSTRNFNTLSHQEQFGECYKLLQQDRFGEREIHSILTQSLREIAPTEANICLAGLVKQRIFDIIVSTNIDTSLEDAFKETGMKEPHDFDVCIPEHDALHHLTYSGKKLSCRVVKAFGDLGSRKYNIAGRGFYLDALQDLKNLVAHISTCDVLVVGFDPVWDADMTHAFTVGKGSFWLVTEEDSPNTHPLASFANQERQVKHVTGKFASSEQFLKALHQHFYERSVSRKENDIVEQELPPHS